ncbi:unnamed protein product [Euphydryas editha]|uniref:Uncharacterized protein n=1 Tax=Euphydryas editha TaxID=104508 RepID=A0AAU9TSV0_EUPED|nr:unnamed protein product [Euphydryas editha]
MDKSEVKESEEMNSSEENIAKNKIESDSSTDDDAAGRNVHASAIKNNLDETSVKKILKSSVMVKSEVIESEEMNSSEEKTPKNKSKVCGRKRKRIESDSSTDGDDALPENALEVERNVHASAIKNNLDETSVKKILKKVVTNDHVLALVKLREEEEESPTEESLLPKITRAKAKELRITCLKLTPIKHIPVKTRPEVEALIAQELPDDEDDEEYEPTPDDVMSDDDHIIESCSDLKPRARTPSTPRQNKTDTSNIVKDKPSEVPQEVSSELQKKLESELEEEATIALRTRSKLSLSATPIEHIESSFDPPDYIPVPDVDDLWNDFLKECLNPASNARNEDDDEADPEYSVSADPDASKSEFS